MPEYNIIYVDDDAIRDAQHSKDKWEKIRLEVGDAVLRSCLDPVYVDGKRVRNYSIGKNMGSLSFVDRVLSVNVGSEKWKLYVWNDSGLNIVSELSQAELTIIRKLIDEEIKSRADEGT